MNQKLKISKTKNMKRYLLIFALLLGAVSSWGQTVADQEKVLQQCIGIGQITVHFDLDIAGVPKSLYALDGQAKLLPGLQVDYNGRILTFVNQETINIIKPDAYFIFNQVNISGNNAVVDFTYNYNCNAQKQVIGLHAVLLKSNEKWSLTGTNK